MPLGSGAAGTTAAGAGALWARRARLASRRLSGSTPTVLLCDQVSPNPGVIPGTNALANGYVVFNGDSGQTLRGFYSIIAANSNVIVSGVHHTQIQLYSPLPWAPTPGVDTFYVSSQAPITQADGDYFGFPYVPAPETAA